MYDLSVRPPKPEGHDYHRCKDCEPCRTLRLWMKARNDDRRRKEDRVCIVDGCGKSASGASSYCGAHGGRRWKLGDVGSPDSRTNDGHARRYQTAHNQLRLKRGSASVHACVDCGMTADDWSLKVDAKTRLIEPAGTDRAGLAFSPDADDYEPRCRSCHATYDGWGRTDALRDQRDRFAVSSEIRDAEES